MLGLSIICVVTMAYCLMGRRLSSTIITAPMIFLALGALVAESGLVDPERAERLLHPVAEVALVVLLFLDAAQTDFKALRQRNVWPVRMLVFGLPLSLIIGGIAGSFLMPGWPLVAIFLVAAILAPTDAALGQPVVTNEAVPIRPRRALIVESGLNDGLALPLVLLFASLTAEEMATSDASWLYFAANQIILGPIAGGLVGWLGGVVLIHAQNRNLTSETFEGIAALALAGLSYLLASQIGGNGFIAAFISGLAFGAIAQDRCNFIYEFVEGEGQLLSWLAFLLLGAALVPEAIAHLTWPVLALILTSLFIVRPLAIWLSLIGSEASSLSRLFFGWFGPRGLATALFALLVLDIVPHELGEEVLHIAVNAVWISALLHGITAAPAAGWYGKRVADMAPCPETQSVSRK